MLTPKITTAAPGVADYQAKTSRVIPLFELQKAYLPLRVTTGLFRAAVTVLAGTWFRYLTCDVPSQPYGSVRDGCFDPSHEDLGCRQQAKAHGVALVPAGDQPWPHLHLDLAVQEWDVDGPNKVGAQPHCRT